MPQRLKVNSVLTVPYSPQLNFVAATYFYFKKTEFLKMLTRIFMAHILGLLINNGEILHKITLKLTSKWVVSQQPYNIYM